MIWGLSVLTALAGNLYLVPSIHLMAHNFCNSNSKDSDTLFLGSCMQVVLNNSHRHRQSHNYFHLFIRDQPSLTSSAITGATLGDFLALLRDDVRVALSQKKQNTHKPICTLEVEKPRDLKPSKQHSCAAVRGLRREGCLLPRLMT